ncbi:hypothetical protein [Azospirillum palustre]
MGCRCCTAELGTGHSEPFHQMADGAAGAQQWRRACVVDRAGVPHRPGRATGPYRRRSMVAQRG